MTYFTEGLLFKDKLLSISRKTFACILALALLIISSKIQMPMIPVPITFQTAVVLLLPILLGSMNGMGVLLSYFLLGAIGMPVFAMTAGSLAGPAYFLGSTGGYLLGFFLAAMAVGMLYDAVKNNSFLFLMALMLAGHAIIFTFGVMWLAYGLPQLGLEAAIIGGFVPFIAGTVLKSFISACIIKSLQKDASSA